MRFNEFKIFSNRQLLKNLCESINLSETLKQHSAGEYPEEEKQLVSQIQHILTVLGYDVGSTGVDGKYGPNTARAVGQFKRDYGLSGDGSEFGEPALQTIEKLASGEIQPTRPFRGQAPSRGTARGGATAPGDMGDGLRGSSALFTMNGASRMTQPNAADNIQATLQGPYKRMVRLFGREVRINDAIARAGTSRETNTPGSQHFHGRALDLDISSFNTEERIRLVQAAKQAGFTGFGFGNSILHVDTGPNRYWDYDISTFGGVRVAQLGNYVTGRA